MKIIDRKIRLATKRFWQIRHRQGLKQRSSGKADAGSRSAVTGGKQLSGFEELAVEVALKAGINHNSIFYSNALELPGYYRPTKKWDLLIIGWSARLETN